MEFSKALIGTSKGLQLIIKAMKEYSKEEEFILVCFGALANLLSLQENCNSFLKLNGLSVLLEALSFFPKNVKLQYYGMVILVSLCSVNECKLRIINDGGIQIVKSNLEVFPANVEVIEHSLKLLDNLLKLGFNIFSFLKFALFISL